MNLFFKFNKISIDKICRLLYPLIFILVSMRLYFRINVSINSFLYDKAFLQILLWFSFIYYRILEPIIILLVIKLFIEIILLFYKKDKI